MAVVVYYALALLSNRDGDFNSAYGAFALFNNMSGSDNTATGVQALFTNATGQENTATGYEALFFDDGDPTNNEGSNNSAFGTYTLFSNTTGYANSAFGWGAMPSNTTGSFNTALGFRALGQSVGAGTVATGSYNTAVGEDALRSVTTGSYNATLGSEAGFDVDTASNVICIGAGVPGVSSVVGEVDNSCYVGNIYNAPVDLNTAVPVFIDQDGKLGTQGFDGHKTGKRGLLNNGQIEDVQTRLTELDCKVAQQSVTIAQQRKQIGVFITQLKDQAEQIQTILAEIQLNRRHPFLVHNHQIDDGR